MPMRKAAHPHGLADCVVCAKSLVRRDLFLISVIRRFNYECCNISVRMYKQTVSIKLLSLVVDSFFISISWYNLY